MLLLMWLCKRGEADVAFSSRQRLAMARGDGTVDGRLVGAGMRSNGSFAVTGLLRGDSIEFRTDVT